MRHVNFSDQNVGANTEASASQGLRLSLFQLTGIAALAVVLALPKTVYELLHTWLTSPEYGHGLILTALAMSIIWRRRGLINALQPRYSLPALMMLVLGFGLHLISIAGDIQAVRFYSLMLVLLASALYFSGFKAITTFAFPALLLSLAVPLHPAINTALTTSLQLISTDIGVWMIRLMGMAALQDGNVINMGEFVLLVEEACSGLRYLLPLISFHLILAYYYRGHLALKALIVVSAIPITVFTNSLRIALTGLVIKYFGSEAASGFLHDFEGLAVFALACFLTLLMLLSLSFCRYRHLNLMSSFRNEPLPRTQESTTFTLTGKSYLLLATVAVFGFANLYLLSVKQEHIPQRNAFSQFPLSLAGRDLYPNELDEQFIEILQPDDYFIGDYVAENSAPVNLYMAYYAVQKNGSLIHSPSQCIPAGGWHIQRDELLTLAPFGMRGHARRAIISKDDTRLLVYYWVHQQGDNYASDREVYFSLIRRSILHGRTDGTLVRLITPIVDDNIETAEKRLEQFIGGFTQVIPTFLPQ